MYMVKKGVFLLFDKNTLEYKGVYAMYPYKEDKQFHDLVNKLVYLDYLEV